MGAFELNEAGTNHDLLDSKRLREECIIALKVYDSCRKQSCLTEKELGPVRAAESMLLGGEQIHEGDIVKPPAYASSVTIDKLKIEKIIIFNKEPSSFRNGYWDIDIKYVFEYRLTFREADGCHIGSIKVHSVYNERVTLFGSLDSDSVIATDLFNRSCDSKTLDSDPFVQVEAKAVGLSAKIRHHCGHKDDKDGGGISIDVTIGLFSIINLFRIVNLLVESRGFCVPEECENRSPLNPCDFFESLDFPMDIFAPPQKPEFFGPGGPPKSGCGCDEDEETTPTES